ncbi:glycoside hydrolase family 47 protein [Aspergillus undulatus]|uniref:glycoside hydrolase family 47 protein n=1 Tax=Aspergillus undulatus TaxID=1810928 RepID=UPI003CCD8381
MPSKPSHTRMKGVKGFRWSHSLLRNRALKFLFVGLLVLGLGWEFQIFDSEDLEMPLKLLQCAHKDNHWDERREEVKDAFMATWDAYAEHAWGQDQFHPISKTGSQIAPSGLGWIIVDSLDTLMTNLTTCLSDARKWLNRGLTYDQDQDVNTFETMIRMLGELLSAHYLSTILPDASTAQLEMKYLSPLTGNEVYWRKAEHVMKVIDDQKNAGRVPAYIHSSRYWTVRYREIQLGCRGDSYYGYLIKQDLQTSGQESIYREMWEEALTGIQKHLVTYTKHSGLQFVAELPQGIGGPLSPKMDYLVCFLPGAIALGATEGLGEQEARRLPSWTPQKEQQMQLARELMKTCWAMYAATDTGLSPEIVWFGADEAHLRPFPQSNSRPRNRNDKSSWKRVLVIKPLDAHNLRRPETPESLFIMHEHTAVSNGKGYTSLQDVTKIPPRKRDNMKSFWLVRNKIIQSLSWHQPDHH